MSDESDTPIVETQPMPRIYDFATGILSRPPTPQQKMDTDAWFVTESMTVQVGETMGRPSAEVQMGRDLVTYLLANGWYIVAFTESDEDGEWQSVATATAHTSSGSVSNGYSHGESVPSGEKELTWSKIGGGKEVYRVVDTPSESTVTTNGSAENTGDSLTTTTNDGAPYWYAYNTVLLQRRRMDAEKVLKDMVGSFTDAYNEGREMNNERYDELVACYLLMLQQTQEKTDAFADLDTSTFQPLADMVVDSVQRALREYKATVGDLPADWLSSRTTEINDRFNALLAEAMQKMVDAGTYNSTVWPTTAAGIERDRQKALDDLKDEMVTLKVDVYGRIATMTADVGQKLLDCGIRIVEARQKMLLGPQELYNTVVKWMLDFMERREDDYPSLDSLVTVAERLGYADGASSSGTTPTPSSSSSSSSESGTSGGETSGTGGS